MATRIITECISDLTGKTGAAPTKFALDGQEYEIDLCPDERATLDQFLARFIKHAAKGYGPDRRRTAAKKAAKPNTETAKMRAWLFDNGFNPPAKGYLSKALVEAYTSGNLAASAPPVAAPVEEAPANAPQKAATPRKATASTWRANKTTAALQDAAAKKDPAAAAQASSEKVTVLAPSARTRKAATSNTVVEKAPTTRAAKKTAAAKKAVDAVTVPAQSRNRSRKAQS